MFREFRHFASRGDIMQLAVGVIIGAVFSDLVRSFTSNIISPILGIFLDKIDFSQLIIPIGKAQIRLGSFISTLIYFIITVIAVYILVKIINIVTTHEPKKPMSETNQLLMQINQKLDNKNFNKSRINHYKNNIRHTHF